MDEKTSLAMGDLVPCGRCPHCLSNRRKEWTFRINQELKVAESAHFLTLTYDDPAVPINEHGNQTLSKKDFQDFMKKLREHNWKMALKHTKWKTVKEARDIVAKLRYYTVGEYGSKSGRPHYHSIMMNMQPEVVQALEPIWSHGFVDVGSVTPESINYVCGYLITKQDNSGLIREKQFSLMSQGLGKNYLINKRYHVENKIDFVKGVNGEKQKLPRYYRDKMFDDKLREEIAETNRQNSAIRNSEELTRIKNTGHSDPRDYQFQQHEIALKKTREQLIKKQKL